MVSVHTSPVYFYDACFCWIHWGYKLGLQNKPHLKLCISTSYPKLSSFGMPYIVFTKLVLRLRISQTAETEVEFLLLWLDCYLNPNRYYSKYGIIHNWSESSVSLHNIIKITCSLFLSLCTHEMFFFWCREHLWTVLVHHATKEELQRCWYCVRHCKCWTIAIPALCITLNRLKEAHPSSIVKGVLTWWQSLPHTHRRYELSCLGKLEIGCHKGCCARAIHYDLYFLLCCHFT